MVRFPRRSICRGLSPRVRSALQRSFAHAERQKARAETLVELNEYLTWDFTCEWALMTEYERSEEESWKQTLDDMLMIDFVRELREEDDREWEAERIAAEVRYATAMAEEEELCRMRESYYDDFEDWGLE